MLAASLLLGPVFFSWSGLGVFVLLLAITMCTGHSVGFHRRLIHRTFQCPKWLERTLVWSGTLVGMQGPFWVMHAHDIRDWAQRQPNCHDFLNHGGGILLDGWWNLHCRLRLAHAPAFDPGPGIGDDPFYRFLQRTWMVQQCRSHSFSICSADGLGRLGRLRARDGRRFDALVRRLPLPYAWPAIWLVDAARCRRTTFRGPRSRRWARAGTTTIMRFRRRRGTGCIRVSSTLASCSCRC